MKRQLLSKNSEILLCDTEKRLNNPGEGGLEGFHSQELDDLLDGVELGPDDDDPLKESIFHIYYSKVSVF